MSAALKPTAHRDEVVYLRSPDPKVAPTFDELAVVTLTHSVRTIDNVNIPAGTRGAVVSIWDGGAAYEIEFAEPVGALATVRREHLREAGTG